MPPLSEPSTREVLTTFISSLRQEINDRSITLGRLPGWITAARVRTAWVHDTLIAVFEDSRTVDTYEHRGSLNADTVLLLDVDDFSPSAASLRARENQGFIILVGQNSSSGTTNFNLMGQPNAFFDCGYAGYHGPRALFNIFLHSKPEESITMATRFIPFALYIHLNDARNPNQFWQRCTQHLLDIISDIDSSAAGDFYASQISRFQTFELTKASGVVVLGKDTGSALMQLTRVRDYLRSQSYLAELIKDLPEIPIMSNEEKVRLWTTASRFSVMIDIEPAGHIAEYEILKQQRSILALLRPKGYGSTYMIGDDSLVDVNFIRTFEFGTSAIEVIPDVIKWAETIARERERSYSKAYPWRRHETL